MNQPNRTSAKATWTTPTSTPITLPSAQNVAHAGAGIDMASTI